MLNYQRQDEWVHSDTGLQSPIDLHRNEAINFVDAPKCNLDQPIYGTTIENSNNSFRIAGIGSILVDNELFYFQELHFHAPSEHLIDGRQFAMEWHFVFKNNDGKTMVLAKFAEVGADNVIYNDIWKNFKYGEITHLVQSIKLTPLMNKVDKVYHYQGSLTTPPLTEGVEWYVDVNPLTISSSILNEYKKVFTTPNNRKVQPLMHRKLLFGTI